MRATVVGILTNEAVRSGSRVEIDPEMLRA
jgi:hypothetical protein